MKADYHLIAVIEFSETMEVLFYYDYFSGRVWANIRKFVKSTKYVGPTKQGLKFDPAKLPELKKAFEMARKSEATMLDEEFLRFSKSSKCDIVVHASLYKGALGVDIREWISTDDYTGWTKSGVRFPMDVIPQVIDALQKMIDTKPDVVGHANQN